MKPNAAKKIVFGSKTKNEKKGEAFFFLSNRKKCHYSFCIEAKITSLMQNEKLDAKRSEKKGKKGVRLFRSSARKRSETDPISFHFTSKRKMF